MAFIHDHIIQQASTVDAGVAATTDITSAAVDAANCDGVLFIVSFGTITANAVTSIHVEQCDTSGGSYAELADSEITVTDANDNKTFYIDVQKPREQFLKLVVDRGTQNAVVGAIIAIKYNCASRPVTQGTNVESGLTVVNAAEAA